MSTAALVIRKAERRQAKLRMLMFARSGAGKTFTSILVGVHLAHLLGTRLCFIDSEEGGADKYADIVPGMDFDVIELHGNVNGYHPRIYMEAMDMAVKAGHGVIVADSISPAWNGKGGILQRVEEEKRTSRNRDQQSAWIKPTEEWDAFIEAIIGCPSHLILCARSKTEWGDMFDERSGKQVRTAVGTAPILRGEFEYEVDYFGDLEREGHVLTWDKNRSNGKVREFYDKPGEDLARDLAGWLMAGGADVEMRVREVSALRPRGVGKAQFADALIAAGVVKRESMLDDAVFAEAKRLVAALRPPAATDGGQVGDEPVVGAPAALAGPDETVGGPGSVPPAEGEVAAGAGSSPAPVEGVEAEALAASPGAVEASGSESAASETAADSPTPGGEEGTMGTVSSPAPSARRRRAPKGGES